eukprot:gene5780-4131_t
MTTGSVRLESDRGRINEKIYLYKNNNNNKNKTEQQHSSKSKRWKVFREKKMPSKRESHVRRNRDGGLVAWPSPYILHGSPIPEQLLFLLPTFSLSSGQIIVCFGDER